MARRVEDLERDSRLLNGILQTFKDGDDERFLRVLSTIRSRTSLDEIRASEGDSKVSPNISPSTWIEAQRVLELVNSPNALEASDPSRPVSKLVDRSTKPRKDLPGWEIVSGNAGQPPHSTDAEADEKPHIRHD